MDQQQLYQNIREIFGNQADNAIATLAGENSTLDPRATNDKNRDGSIDRGLFQVNSNTFADFFRRKPELLAANGINSFDDMYDPIKNLIMARIIYNEQGWNAWYGSPVNIRMGRPDEPLLLNRQTNLVNLISQPQPTPQPTPTQAVAPVPTLGPTPSPTQAPVQYQPQQFQMPRIVQPAYAAETKVPTRVQQPNAFENAMTAAQDVYSGIEKGIDWVKSNITQRFGVRNPRLEVFNPRGINTGTDFSMKIGTPISLPRGNWVVEEAYSKATQKGYIGNNENRGYGNSVVVRNADTGERIRFSHLSKVLVKPGQTVIAGDIAFSGNTGNVTGPHLDVEYFDKNGRLSDVTKSDFFKGSKIAKVPVAQGYEQVKTATQPMSFVKQAQAAEKSFRTSVVPTPPIKQTAVKQTQVSQPSQISSPVRQTSAISSPIKQTSAISSPIKTTTVTAVSKPTVMSSSNAVIVKSGQTLSGIAKSMGTSLTNLLKANPQITNPNRINVGQAIKAPTSSVSKVTSSVKSSTPAKTSSSTAIRSVPKIASPIRR